MVLRNLTQEEITRLQAQGCSSTDWQREKFAETRDFISFTKAEMDYLFERQEPCSLL